MIGLLEWLPQIFQALLPSRLQAHSSNGYLARIAAQLDKIEQHLAINRESLAVLARGQEELVDRARHSGRP